MNVRQLLVGIPLAAAIFAIPAAATDNPHELPGSTLVTADKAKDLIGKGVQVFDVRSANEYAEEHIKGARNVPYKEKSDKKVGFDATQDSFDLAKLPADKNAEMLFYCNGTECWKSYKAGTVAIKAGYKKLYWLRGGMPEWKSKGYPVE
jgi:rhodanese-related sulfurtransferase